MENDDHIFDEEVNSYDGKSNEQGKKSNKYCLKGEEHYKSLKDVFKNDEVEWTSEVLEGKGALRQRVLNNIYDSKVARESSNYRFRFKNGYYVEHTTGPVGKFTSRGGVSGGHNLNEFKKYFNLSEQYKLDNIKIRKSEVNGLFDVNYKVKVEKKNFRGERIGEYKIMPNGDNFYKETVYDPTIISNQQIIELSKKAMIEGIRNKRMKILHNQKKLKYLVKQSLMEMISNLRG